MEISILGPLVSPFVIKLLTAADYKQLRYSHQDHVGIVELRRLNPQTGKVPVVRIDHEVIYDTTLILRRFDAVKPDPPLFSPDAVVAARQRMLEDWSDESLYWYSQAIRWSPENEPRTIAQNSRFVPAALRPAARPLLRRLVGRQPEAQGLGRLPYDVLLNEFGQRLDDLVILLGEQPFFFDTTPSAADFAIYGVFHCGFYEGVTPDFEREVMDRPALTRWRDRVEQLRRKAV